MSYYTKRFFGQQRGIVTDGLKLWLDASNPASYPDSGTTWFDLSGNNNNGTMVNRVIPLSNAMYFGGTNDYVFGENDVTQLSSTISVWVKCMFTKNSGLFVSRAISGRGLSAFLLVSNGLKVRFDTGVDLWLTNYNIPLNEFKQITLTATTTSKKIYIDGNLFQEKTGVFAADPSSMYTVGSSNVNGGYLDNYFSGNLNDIFMYDKALSDTEVLQNFNATKSKYGL